MCDAQPMFGHTFLDALIGGLLIGAAASALLLVNGRVAGCSGIVGGIIRPATGEVFWRASFVAGLLAGGAIMMLAYPAAMPTELTGGVGRAVAAGLLVGGGTSMGNGCTSGHGICGMSRLSPRSIVATCTFMVTGAAAVWFIQHFGWA